MHLSWDVLPETAPALLTKIGSSFGAVGLGLILVPSSAWRPPVASYSTPPFC
jgi:hypothetical protein